MFSHTFKDFILYLSFLYIYAYILSYFKFFYFIFLKANFYAVKAKFDEMNNVYV